MISFLAYQMTILAAVDRSSQVNNVIEEAERLGDAFDDEIHVVHVLPRSEFGDLERTSIRKTRKALSIEQIQKVAKDIATEAASQLASTSKSIGLAGEPSEQIVDYGADNNMRYIVISGKKRSPAGKAIFGSTTQSIVLNSEIPVVVIPETKIK